MKAPVRIETARLWLRKPLAADADAIFARYSSDREVTRLLGWPRHRTLEDTRTFLAFSDAEWERWPAGPYLIESRVDRRLLGSTGFGFESVTVAATGYVLAHDAWGFGFATEALASMVECARALKIWRLYALCHTENAPSAHVLEKCGFVREALLERHIVFPNLASDQPADCFRYSRTFA